MMMVTDRQMDRKLSWSSKQQDSIKWEILDKRSCYRTPILENQLKDAIKYMRGKDYDSSGIRGIKSSGEICENNKLKVYTGNKRGTK